MSCNITRLDHTDQSQGSESVTQSAKAVPQSQEQNLTPAAREEPSSQSKPKLRTKPDQNIKRKKQGRRKVAWVGTSISKVLDKKKFKDDCDVDLQIERAYCIQEETNARFKKDNFQAVVPEVLKDETITTLVLQTGSIEITNLEVNKAMVDSEKDIEEYKKGMVFKS